MISILRIRAWRQSELHQVRDALLAASAVWILHAELLSLCILIQRPELLALGVFWFRRLLSPRRWL